MTLRTSNEFITWNAPPIIPIIKERILPVGGMMFIWGNQETFKSWLMLGLAWSVAEGEDWLIFGTTKAKVLFINTELPEIMFQERWQQMAQVRGTPKDLWCVSDMNLKLDTEEGKAKLTTWGDVCNPDLIIIDAMYRTVSGDINTSRTANILLDTLGFARERWTCAISGVHHSRKTAFDIPTRQQIHQGINDATGSKYLMNNASTVFEVRRPDRNVPVITIIPEKLWFEKSSPPTTSYMIDNLGQAYLI